MESLFVFNEAFERAYDKFIEEQNSASIDELFESVVELAQESDKTFKLCEDYFDLYAKAENGLLTEDTDALDNVMFKFMALGEKKLKDLKDHTAEYESAGGIVFAKELKDLKFPRNIIVFIKGLCSWLLHLIKFVFVKIKNAIKTIIGKEVADKDKASYQSLKDRINTMLLKYAKIEKFGTPSQQEGDNRITANEIDADRVEAVGEGVVPTEVLAQLNEDNVKYISIDLSKDLLDIKEHLKYFFTNYDNAQGSSREDLFGSSDLKMLLGIFERIMDDIEDGRSLTYEIDGRLAEIDAIDSTRAKQLMENTRSNINQLRNVYTETANKIITIGEIVGHKQLQLVHQMGASFKMYSVATCKEMLRILDVVDPRLKDAKEKYHELEVIEVKYTELVKELEKLADSYLAVGTVMFTNTYQRKIADLLRSARYITQTITLRISGLAVYIKELEDIREMLSAIISVNGDTSFFDRLKGIFK